MLNLEDFVAACRAALTEPSPELAVKEVLARAVERSSDVEAAVGTPRQGQIATLHHDRDLTVLNVVWAPGMSVFPHDHAMWAVIGLYGGREDNTFYRRGARGLQVAGARQVEGGDTIVLGRNVIHAVTNPLRAFTGAIHIYGGDFFAAERREWDPATLQERPWDAGRTRKVFADANARWLAECAAARQPGGDAR